MSVDRVLLRQKALAAASSVVLALAIPACVPGLPKPSSAGDSDPADTSSGADTSGADTSSGDTSTTDTSGGDSSGGDSSGGDSSDGRPDCTSDTATSVSECCDELYVWCTANTASRDEFNECYYGSDFSGSTGCIPWGPPAPPRMRPAVA